MVYQKKADFNRWAQEFSISPIVARIIRNRDMMTDEQVGEYLQGGEECLHSPMLFKDMEKAVHIIEKKIEEGKKLRIINDYDIDGVCSGYILYDGMKRLGGNVDIRTPERLRDGYGLNIRLVEEALADGVDTIITCDNGIAAKQQIAYGKERGMTIIVTDHHEVPFEEEGGRKISILPPADAIVNHKQEDCPYPFKELCGAAVAYKLICCLYEKMKRELPEYREFVAIATIGDVMVLQQENRILTKQGLQVLQHTQNVGLRALIDVLELKSEQIDSEAVGFQLGPCINAVGRLDSAKRAVDLFAASSYPLAYQKAVDMKEWNEQRKKLTEEGTIEAVNQVEHGAWREDPIYVIYLPDCHESLAGIIAGRIREQYNRPVFVFTDTENTDEEGNFLVKGSGRSVDGYSMYEGMHSCSELLYKFGGHKGAGGLSLKQENLEPFRKKINQLCPLSPKDFVQQVWIDAPAPFSYMNLELVKDLEVLQPTGNGNEKPCFAQKNIKLLKLDVYGEARKIMRMKVRGEDGQECIGVYFNARQLLEEMRQRYGEEEVEKALKGLDNPIFFRAVYMPRKNEFRGNVSVQLEFTRIQLE